MHCIENASCKLFFQNITPKNPQFLYCGAKTLCSYYLWSIYSTQYTKCIYEGQGKYLYSTLYKSIRHNIAIWLPFLLRFEERLQGKSENITKELLKLNGRVKELEDLGEMKNIQQYTYEVR